MITYAGSIGSFSAQFSDFNQYYHAEYLKIFPGMKRNNTRSWDVLTSRELVNLLEYNNTEITTMIITVTFIYEMQC